MTLTKIMPWGRGPISVRRLNEYSPPSSLTQLEDPFKEVERLFDRFLGLSPAFCNNAVQSEFSPVMDVHETEKEFRLNLEMPGMTEKDIDISISKDVLMICGEKKEEKEENAKGIYRVERRYGSFSRSIPLPDNCVDTERVEANFKNGVLSIKLPKAGGYKESVRKIAIQSDKSEEGDGDSDASTN